MGEVTQKDMVLQKLSGHFYLKILNLSIFAFICKGRIFSYRCNDYSMVLGGHILAG